MSEGMPGVVVLRDGWYDVDSPTGTVHYIEKGRLLCAYGVKRNRFALARPARSFEPQCRHCERILASNIRKLRPGIPKRN